jgi:hypothetical protein
VTRALVLGLVVVAACSQPRPRPARPIEIRPALPTGFVLETVVAQVPAEAPRLRLDGGGRPFLVSKDVLVPLQKLPSGEPAKPFRIGKADAIGDVTWLEEGVIMLVVGAQLGVVTEAGFQPILPLPHEGMRVVAATANSLWLFAPGSVDGHLYLYEKGDKLSEPLRIEAPITAVSGTPDRFYVVTGHSLLRVAKGALELVFDGDEDIRAVAAAANGVLFATKSGSFYISDAGAITRLTSDGASAIELHGDELFMVTDAHGIVRGAPVSSLACTSCVPDPSTFDPPPPPPRRPPRPVRAFSFAPVTGPVLLGLSSTVHTIKGSLTGTVEEATVHIGKGAAAFTAGVMRGDLEIDESDSFTGVMRYNTGYKGIVGLDIMRGPGVALLVRRSAQLFYLFPSGSVRVAFNDDGAIITPTLAAAGLRFVLAWGLRLDVHVPTVSGWLAAVNQSSGEPSAGFGYSFGADVELGWSFW